MDILRTPDDRFAAVEGWFEPTYRTTSDDLRMAVVDEGPRDAPIGLLVQFGSGTELPDEVVAAPAQAAWEVLRRFDTPFLCAFSDGDPITRHADALFTGQVPGAEGQPHTTITGAAHFLQEDQGKQLGQVVVDWLRGTS